ncbi:hypothetical protein BDZ97DRAFT_1925553 [Flammula alnicola]|nr:hypothetical protein BDZ97DRAFT_1925553 [Flammula alnicola]
MSHKYIFNELYRKFSFLLLCFDDWKASYIAGRCLSTYHATIKKRLARDANAIVKTEPIPKVEDGPTLDKMPEVEDRKRRRDVSDSGGPNAKCIHIFKTPDAASSSGHRSASPPIDLQLLAMDLHLQDGQAASGINSGLNSTPSTAPAAAVTSVAPSPPTETAKTASAEATPDDATGILPPTVPTPATTISAVPPPPNKMTKAMPAPVTADVVEAAARPSRAAARWPIINPISKIHGPPSAPTKHSDALRDTQAAQKAKVDAAVTNADTLQSRVSEDTSNEKAPEAPSSSKTATGNLKKVTKSNAPKNLCYKAYLDNHEPLTPAAFEAFYKTLPKDEIKHWNELSKSKKSRTVEDHADDG